MMKFIFTMIMMVPLCWLGGFWLNQVIWFILSFLFILMISFNNFQFISMDMGIDLMSYLLVLLSFWICSLMLMASEKIFLLKNWSKFFKFVLLMLMFSLFMTFCSMNMFLFYLFFEVSLIPTLILILGWGYQPERLQAGLYLLFYTLFASLPMMVSLFYFYESFGSMHYFFLEDFGNGLMYLLINMVFFIKIPMFLVHLWLPKAHVEAPISGSMILAGIMLKLGGYGLLRFMILFMSSGLVINYIFMSISLVGSMIISFICLRQSDMKLLIAYSSVCHMGLVLGGILTMNYWGMVGSMIMMISHGLCSSGLFCLANISYERLGSRSLYLNKGLINLMPNLSLMWFLLVSSNMAAPPSLNLVGEVILISSLVGYSSVNIFLMMLISFFGAAYSLYLYSYSQHGKLFMGLYSFSCCSIREYLLLILHWLPLNLLILSSDLLNWV